MKLFCHYFNIIYLTDRLIGSELKPELAFCIACCLLILSLEICQLPVLVLSLLRVQRSESATLQGSQSVNVLFMCFFKLDLGRLNKLLVLRFPFNAIFVSTLNKLCVGFCKSTSRCYLTKYVSEVFLCPRNLRL